MTAFIIVGAASLLLLIVTVTVCTADIHGVTDRTYSNPRRDNETK
jgi:hypothetical protein